MRHSPPREAGKTAVMHGTLNAMFQHRYRIPLYHPNTSRGLDRVDFARAERVEEGFEDGLGHQSVLAA